MNSEDTMHQYKRRSDDNGYLKILKLWPILAVAAGLISTWTILKYRVEALETRAAKVEDKIEDIPVIRADIKRILEILDGEESRRRWREREGR